MVSPMRAARPNSSATWRRVAAGTVVMSSAHSGVISRMCSLSTLKAVWHFTPSTSYSPSRAGFSHSS